jgi:hypothetical protein
MLLCRLKVPLGDVLRRIHAAFTNNHPFSNIQQLLVKLVSPGIYSGAGERLSLKASEQNECEPCTPDDGSPAQDFSGDIFPDQHLSVAATLILLSSSRISYSAST